METNENSEVCHFEWKQMKMVPIRSITGFIPKKIKEKYNRLIQDISVKKL